MKIHIIFCNDSPELAVLGTLRYAKKKLRTMRREDYVTVHQHNPRAYKSMADYTNVHF